MGRDQTKTCSLCYFRFQHHPCARGLTTVWKPSKPLPGNGGQNGKSTNLMSPCTVYITKPQWEAWGNDRVVSSACAWSQGCCCFHTLSVADDDSLCGFTVRLSCLSPNPANINVPSGLNQTRKTAPAHSPPVWCLAQTGATARLFSVCGSFWWQGNPVQMCTNHPSD